MEANPLAAKWSHTVARATDSALRVYLEAFEVFLGAIIRIAPHHELVRIVRVFRDVQDRMINHVIRILRFGTVGALELHATEMRTQLVLILTRTIIINHPAVLADTTANFRVSYGYRRRHTS